MAFLKDLGKQVSGLAQTVGKRTGEAAEIGRLNARKQGILQQIDELYNQIGKSYYATRAAAIHEQADRLGMQVEHLLAETDKLDRMVDRLRQQRRCPECGGVQPSSARFCASCGARLPEDEPEPKVEADEAEDAAEDVKPRAAEIVQEMHGDVAVEITWPEAQREAQE